MKKITRLELWRRDNGLTYEELAQLLGCVRQHAWTICHSGMQSAERIQKIIELTGGLVTIKDLAPGVYAEEEMQARDRAQCHEDLTI